MLNNKKVKIVIYIIIALFTIRLVSTLHFTRTLCLKYVANKESKESPRRKGRVRDFNLVLYKSNVNRKYAFATYEVNSNDDDLGYEVLVIYNIKDYVIPTYHHRVGIFIPKEISSDEKYWIDTQFNGPIIDTHDKKKLHIQIYGFNRIGAKQAKITTNKGIDILVDLPDHEEPFIIDLIYEDDEFLKYFDSVPLSNSYYDYMVRNTYVYE